MKTKMITLGRWEDQLDSFKSDFVDLTQGNKKAHMWISKKHCVIVYDETNIATPFQLINYSKNGVWVDDEWVLDEPIYLKDKCHIVIKAPKERKTCIVSFTKL